MHPLYHSDVASFSVALSRSQRGQGGRGGAGLKGVQRPSRRMLLTSIHPHRSHRSGAPWRCSLQTIRPAGSADIRFGFGDRQAPPTSQEGGPGRERARSAESAAIRRGAEGPRPITRPCPARRRRAACIRCHAAVAADPQKRGRARSPRPHTAPDLKYKDGAGAGAGAGSSPTPDDGGTISRHPVNPARRYARTAFSAEPPSGWARRSGVAGAHRRLMRLGDRRCLLVDRAGAGVRSQQSPERPSIRFCP